MRLWISGLVLIVVTSCVQAQTRPSTEPIVDLQAIDDALSAGSNEQALVLLKPALAANKPQIGARLSDDTQIILYEMNAVALLRTDKLSVAHGQALRAFTSTKTSRSITLNLATTEILIPSYSPHAVTLLTAFCKTAPTDEDAMDLWGVAIDRASKQMSIARLSPVVDQYLALVPQLEATRPGMKRWGTTWIKKFDYDNIQLQRKSALAHVKWCSDRLADAQTQLSNAQRDLETAEIRNNVRRNRDRSLPTFELNEVQSAQNEVQKAQSAISDAQAQVPMPTWDAPLTGIVPDLTLTNK